MTATKLRVRELETLLGRMRAPKSMMANYDGWERHGRDQSSPGEADQMARDYDEARRVYDAAKSALEALVAKLRAEEPQSLEAWIVAHEAFLAWVIENDGPEKYRTWPAEQEIKEWAKVRAGTIAFAPDDIYYDLKQNDHYRAMFGIDMKTLAPVD